MLDVPALRRRLTHPLPGVEAQRRLAPRLRTEPEPDVPLESLRAAAALVLLYPHDGTWRIPLTVRGPELRHHTGQISLPGGRVDPGESIDEAALREAHEEVGIAPADVEILGWLTPLPVWVSGYLLHPVVGMASSRPDFSLATGEVERLIELPVRRLREPGVVRWEERIRSRPPRAVMDVPYFDVEGAHVWGATAMVLAEFMAAVEDMDV